MIKSCSPCVALRTRFCSGCKLFVLNVVALITLVTLYIYNYCMYGYASVAAVTRGTTQPCMEVLVKTTSQPLHFSETDITAFVVAACRVFHKGYIDATQGLHLEYVAATFSDRQGNT